MVALIGLTVHPLQLCLFKRFRQAEVKLIPDVSQALAWLEKHPQALRGIQRGLERETLRVNADGTLATTGHPPALGSALTHKWITTDFAEALLEFITPVDGDIEHMLTFMRDVHRYTARQLGDERMWPLSMPCYIAPVRILSWRSTAPLTWGA